MSFLKLTDEQELIRKTARDFADREIRPFSAKWDEEAKYPADLVRKLGETGLMGICVPSEFEGAGMDSLSYSLALEEIAAADASISVMMSVHNSLVCEGIVRFGTDAQKRKHLPSLAAGQRLGCFALSEPEAGSDPGSLRSTAVRSGDSYVLRGVKNFITSGNVADLAVVFANVDPSKGKKGITAFLVDTKTLGYKPGPAEKKMGLNASPTTSVYLEDCKVSAAERLGNEGEGLKIALSLLSSGRIGIATQSVGIARAAMEASVKYAKVRTQFGQPIAGFQAIQWKIADMAVRIEAARLLTWKAAALKGDGQEYRMAAAEAKLFASEMANAAATQAVQIFGGYGYIKDYPVEKHLRDARATTLYEGTSEIQRLLISRDVLAGSE